MKLMIHSKINLLSISLVLFITGCIEKDELTLPVKVDLMIGISEDSSKDEYLTFTGGKIVLARKSNLYFGIGLLDNLNEIRLLDMASLDGSKNVRFVMRWTQGLQVGFGTDSVVYSA